MMEVGRVCMKIAGREAGKYCVIVKNMEGSFVMVSGPRSMTGVKRRRCNTEHLEPMDFTIDIKPDAPDSEVEQAMKKGEILSKITAKGTEKAKEKPAEEKTVHKEEKPKGDARLAQTAKVEKKPEHKKTVKEKPKGKPKARKK